jgi:hypothetical protein
MRADPERNRSYRQTQLVYRAQVQPSNLCTRRLSVSRADVLPLRGPGDLAHEGKKVLLAVMKESHPEVVIGHCCYKVRLILELHVAGEKSLVRGVDIWHGEIKDRARMILSGILRASEHQAYPSTIEESQGARAEKKRQGKSVAVEGGSAFQVVYIGSNLSHSRNSSV